MRSIFRRLRWRSSVLVLIAASFWPLYVMAANAASIVRPERILVIVAIAFVFGMLLIQVLNAFGMPVEPAENSSFMVVVMLMSAGPILRQLGTVALALLLIVAALFGWLFTRLKGRVIVTALVWGTAVALVVGPVAALFESLQAQGPSAVVTPAHDPIEMAKTPDIFLVVFDGYPGSIASQQDGLTPGVVDVVGELRMRGFGVPNSSWTSYWTTTLSIPSLMEMDYMVRRPWTGMGTVRDLQRVLSGDSAVVETLRANGYDTYMLESGWSGGSCGPGFDHCVPAPLIDEATYLTLKQTIAWVLLEDSPGPSIEGTFAAFDWLTDHAPELSESSDPEFVFTHVVTPHPPLYLTPECSLDLAVARGGAFFVLPGVPDEERARYLEEQIDCMDRFMVSFADQISPDDVLIYVSDHGSDRRNQNDPAYTDWDREAIVERMNNFLAVRLPVGCEIGEQVVVPNVFRAVLDCLSGSPIDPLPERMWVNPMRELGREVVGELLAMEAATPSLEG